MSREISQDFFSYFKDVICFSETWRTMEDDASKLIHYIEVMMGAMASQITSLTIVYSTVYSDADQGKSQLRVTGLCVGNSPGTGEFPHKWPVTRKMFPLGDVIMNQLCAAEGLAKTLTDTMLT